MKATTTYYRFTFLFRFGIGATATLYVPWLHEIGLTLSEIALLNAVFWGAVLLFELPTGMLADGRGRGWSIKMGALIYGIGALVFSQVTGFYGALVSEFILAVGFTFLSGATTAWITDAPDRDDELQNIFANVNIVSGITTVIATLLAVYLTDYLGTTVYWYLLAVFSLSASVFAWHSMQRNEPERAMKEFEALRHAVDHLKRSRDLRWAAVASAVTGLFGTFNMYWAVLMLVYVSKIELGWMWTGMYLALALSGWLVRSGFGKRLGPASGIMFSFILAGFPMMFFGFTVPVASWFVLMAIHEVGRGSIGPFIDTFVNERIPSDYRATFGSLQSFIGSAGMSAVLLGSAVYMHFLGNGVESIILLWTITGGVLVVSSIILWILRPKKEF